MDYYPLVVMLAQTPGLFEDRVDPASWRQMPAPGSGPVPRRRGFPRSTPALGAARWSPRPTPSSPRPTSAQGFRPVGNEPFSPYRPLASWLVPLKPSRGSELHTWFVGSGMRCNFRSSHMFLGGASSPKMRRRCSTARLPHPQGGPRGFASPPHDGFAFLASYGCAHAPSEYHEAMNSG